MDGATDWSGTMGFAASMERADPAIVGAVDRMIASGGSVLVARLAALAQLSERQFRRRFHAATGIAPKQYADVQRVRRALILALEDPDWAGVAHDSGFADQPHLARDIKLRFGAAPTRISGYLGGIRHELLEDGDVRNIQAGAKRAA
jgi:transcriptional regulator GlxA family with amidase domain